MNIGELLFIHSEGQNVLILSIVECFGQMTYKLWLEKDQRVITLSEEQLQAEIVPSEEKTEKGVTFKLTRELIDGYITKNIKFNTPEKSHSYYEKVEALTLSDLKTLFSKANLKIVHTFGDYKLNYFNEDTSDRLIIIAEKI